jgi:peptidoglycan/xylan/chitin deacetylase (PgdA/CDA1 family)
VASIVFDDGFLSVYSSVFPFLKMEGIPFSIFMNKSAVENNWLWSSNLLINHQSGNEEFLRLAYEKCFEGTQIEFEQFKLDPFQVLISQKKSIRPEWFEDEHMAKRPIYLSAAKLLELHQKGVHIASHTVNHKILSSCSDQEIEFEIGENCAYLENLLGSKVDHLAIPFGFPETYDQRALQAAGKFHSYVYSTDRHLVTQGALTPRLGIRNDSRKELVKHTNVAVLHKVLKQSRA